jgi:hypothetical protein
VCEHTVVAEHDLLDDLRLRQGKQHDVTAVGDLGDRGGGFGVAGRDVVGDDVETEHRAAGLGDGLGHPATHVAKADETDTQFTHRSAPSFMWS